MKYLDSKVLESLIIEDNEVATEGLFNRGQTSMTILDREFVSKLDEYSVGDTIYSVPIYSRYYINGQRVKYDTLKNVALNCVLKSEYDDNLEAYVLTNKRLNQLVMILEVVGTVSNNDSEIKCGKVSKIIYRGKLQGLLDKANIQYQRQTK